MIYGTNYERYNEIALLYKVNINDNIWTLKDSIKYVRNYYEKKCVNRKNGKIDDNNIDDNNIDDNNIEKLFPILSKNITEEDVKKNFISIANELLQYTVKFVYKYSVEDNHEILIRFINTWENLIILFTKYSNYISNTNKDFYENFKILITDSSFYDDCEELLGIIHGKQENIIINNGNIINSENNEEEIDREYDDSNNFGNGNIGIGNINDNNNNNNQNPNNNINDINNNNNQNLNNMNNNQNYMNNYNNNANQNMNYLSNNQNYMNNYDNNANNMNYNNQNYNNNNQNYNNQNYMNYDMNQNNINANNNANNMNNNNLNYNNNQNYMNNNNQNNMNMLNNN